MRLFNGEKCDRSKSVRVGNNSSKISTKFPIWYNLAELAIADKRVQNYLNQERIRSEAKHLTLPFIKQFSMTEGN